MPFPLVFCMPEGTSQATFRQIRTEMVATLSAMIPKVKPGWVVPRFLADMADAPVTPDEGGSTILIQLDTAMFTKLDEAEANELAPRVTRALCNIAHRALNARFEVECMVMGANPAWISVVPADVPVPVPD